jgi:hypothetical protein
MSPVYIVTFSSFSILPFMPWSIKWSINLEIYGLKFYKLLSSSCLSDAVCRKHNHLIISDRLKNIFVNYISNYYATA